MDGRDGGGACRCLSPLPQLLGGQPVSLEAEEGRELRPLWGRPPEKAHQWRLLFLRPQVQASEVASDDQDNPEVFYTVERDESGEVICLCSDMGEAYDKIGGSPLRVSGPRAHPSRGGAFPWVTARDPRRPRGGLVGQPQRGWSTKANTAGGKRCLSPLRAAAPPDSGAQLPKGHPGMPS